MTSGWAKSVTLVAICYEWNTKAEVVSRTPSTISSVVSLTSSSPLNCRFSAFQRSNKMSHVTEFTVLLLPKAVHLFLYILHGLNSSCLNRPCLYRRHCWHTIWDNARRILLSLIRIIMQSPHDTKQDFRPPLKYVQCAKQNKTKNTITIKVQNKSTTNYVITLIFQQLKGTKSHLCQNYRIDSDLTATNYISMRKIIIEVLS